ncbi:hypothetical protein [Streptomyces californicus]|nr:hypothetical protein [Streptomyces californicus]MDW4918765.1 hypothetical protein [Streptomyces californicus]
MARTPFLHATFPPPRPASPETVAGLLHALKRAGLNTPSGE